jgi:hypothetical protein
MMMNGSFFLGRDLGGVDRGFPKKGRERSKDFI